MEGLKDYSMTYIYVATLSLIALVPILVQGLRNPLARVPGPWYTLYTDLVLKKHHLSGQKPSYALKLHRKYGPIVRISPTEVHVSSPSSAAQIHSIKRPFLKSDFYTKFVPGVENVFNTVDTEFHRRHRRFLSNPMSESQLKMFWPQIEARFDFAMEQMRKEANNRGAVDICKWFLYLATDVIGELSFGDSFRMLEKDEVDQYIVDLQMAQKGGGVQLAFPWLFASPFAKHLPFFKNVRASQSRTLGYAKQSLARHRALTEKQASLAKPTLLSRLYKADENGETLSQSEVSDAAVAYIIAGSDTTSNTLTFLIWTICREPLIKEKLIRDLENLPKPYNSNDLKALHYLNLVVQEGLRMYATAPGGLPRVVPSEGSEIEGIWLPGGSTVITSAYCLHRDPAVFPEPERFDPYRWESPTKEMKDSWMPFGGGTRVCLGLHLASQEIRLGLAKFFMAFPHAKVSELEGMNDSDMVQEMYFLMAPKGHRCLIEIE